MATWDFGDKFKFELPNDVYTPGEKSYYQWKYFTGTDSLTITETHPEVHDAYTGKPFKRLGRRLDLGDDQGRALYRCLHRWMVQYGGEDQVIRQQALAEKETEK